MNEKEFYKEVTNDMIVDLKGCNMLISNNEQKEVKRKHKLQSVAAALLIGVLGVGSISAGAYALHKWSIGMQERFQVSSEDQAKLEKTDLVQYPDADDQTGKTSVTQNGVTVSATQTIVDNYYAYVALKVEGYQVKPGQTPGFSKIDSSLDGKMVSNVSSFYNGTIDNGSGRAIRADGSELQIDEDGSIIDNYMMQDGTLEYHFLFYPNGPSGVKKGGFFGKDLHIELSDLGIYGENEVVTDVVKGNWAFDLKLRGDQTSKIIETEVPLGNAGAVLTECEVSPISMRAVFDTKNMTTSYTDSYDGFPKLSGVKLKDGTLLTCITDGGSEDFVGNQQYEAVFALGRIINVDEVESLLFVKNAWGEDGTCSIDNFYEVPFSK